MSENLFDDTEDDEDDDVVDVEGEVVESETTEDLPTAQDTSNIVKPVDNIEEVVEVYDQFEDLKERLLDREDLTEIGNGVHVNKSGWRKIATAFNVSVETTSIEKEVDDGVVRYTVTARAVAPNDKSTTASGLCASNESNHMDAGSPDDGQPQNHPDYFKVDGKWRRLKDPKEVNEHNIMATAETRAKNRAISDLVGGGEVSAEELTKKKKEDILE